MIVNVRGTSGSGKSTLVRNIMALYPVRSPYNTQGRKRPLGYSLGLDSDPPLTLFVPGHYETACGGCDTIKTVDEVYRMVRVAALGAPVLDVIYEGIMVQDDVRRAVEMDLELRATGQPPLVVIGLTTPVEECLAAVRGRREARGDARELNPKNTVDRARRQLGVWKRLRAAGVAVEEHDRAAAFARVCALLRLPSGAPSGS